jgi:signal transduction histidine kinase
VTAIASGPRLVALAPLREVMLPLLGSLALLGVALAAATAVQLRFGLHPLRQLRAALADVRMGRARRVPDDQPDELAPLVAELNTLLDQSEAQLEHARRHVADLAHGLKTPLAALALRLAESGRDPDGSLGAAVAQIDERVRHHLGRARAVTPGGARRARTMLAPAVADLTDVMRRIHADRAIDVSTRVGSEIAVAIDPQDLDEMVGNLLDNAWRHSRSVVSVEATVRPASIELAIEDDGPGLSEEEIGQALVRGRRLDETGDGHGFGLSIAQELAELSGGHLALSQSMSLGGLRVALSLPADIGQP